MTTTADHSLHAPSDTFGSSPRTAAHAVVKMLVRAVPILLLERFGQAYVMPTKSTKVAKFRRYNALALATTPLVEGVTPNGKKVTTTDVTATREQFGDYVSTYNFRDAIIDGATVLPFIGPVG